MKNNVKQFKVIFKEQEKKDGTKFWKMLTILKGKGKDGKDLFAPIRFGDAVNTNIWKHKNQVVSAENKEMEDGSQNIRIPKDFKPYEYKGKKIYPYIYIQEITGYKESVYKGNGEDNYINADDVDFSLDGEDEPIK